MTDERKSRVLQDFVPFGATAQKDALKRINQQTRVNNVLKIEEQIPQWQFGAGGKLLDNCFFFYRHLFVLVLLNSDCFSKRDQREF